MAKFDKSYSIYNLAEVPSSQERFEEVLGLFHRKLGREFPSVRELQHENYQDNIRRTISALDMQGQLVGAALWRYSSDDESLTLRYIAVEDGWTQHHVGTTLLSALENTAKTVEVPKINLQTFRREKSDFDLPTWYERQGYHITERIRDILSNRLIFMMAKQL